jgi:hypothetical protein
MKNAINRKNLKFLAASVLVLGCSLIGAQLFANAMPVITITAQEPSGVQVSVSGPNITLTNVKGAGTESISFTVLISNIPGAPGTGGNLPQSEDSYISV